MGVRKLNGIFPDSSDCNAAGDLLTVFDRTWSRGEMVQEVEETREKWDAWQLATPEKAGSKMSI